MSDLQARIARFLLAYHLQRVVIDDSPGDHLPLVDALSGDGDIGVGKAEIDALAEALAEEIEGGGSLNTYLVWDTEYLDEGAQEIEAESLDEALAIAAEQGDEDDHPSRYDGCVLTPELEAKRRAMEGYRP